MLHFYYYKIATISSYTLSSSLELYSHIVWWFRIEGHIEYFWIFYNWNKPCHSLIQRFTSLPLPLFPCICFSLPRSTIIFKVNWPHDSCVKIWCYTLIFKNSKVLCCTMMTINFLNKCTFWFIISDLWIIWY
jgi:hypothetical protein